MTDHKHSRVKWDVSRRMPGTAQAVVRTLTPEKGVKSKPSDDKKLNLSPDTLSKKSDQISQDIVDADSIFQQLPDLELAEQILVGSIISPKDMSTVNLNYRVEEGSFDSEIVGNLLEVVKAYFKKNFKIEDRLDEMLSRMLFKRGADVHIVIPQNNLDQLINGSSQLSLEHFKQIERRLQVGKSLGILGHPTNSDVSLESWHGPDVTPIANVTGVTVTDNFDVLKRPAHSARRRKTSIDALINRRTVSMEQASKGLTSAQIDKLYGSDENQPQQPSAAMIPSEYQTTEVIGHSFIINAPMESVIPVHAPGDPTEHVGYFLMTDPDTGRPVVSEKGRDYYGEMRNNFNNKTENGTSDIVQQVRQEMGGRTQTTKTSIDEIQNAYATIVENDLVNRLRNGIYGEGFSVGFTQEIYSIMLYRSFKNKGTQLVYIPAEFVVYMAFDYDDNGVGKSLLKQTSILSSMRSVLLFANTMKAVRGAIGRKKATINVDASDPDPQRTIADIQTTILEGVRRGFPLGSPDPSQIMDFLQRSGYDFAINIEGENYPGTSVEYDDYQTDGQGGNPELEDRLRRLHISGLGMNPEQVDPTQSPDFATSVVQNDLIMTRRILRYQKRFCSYLTRLIRLITVHSPDLLAELKEDLKDNRGKLTDKQRDDLPKDVLNDFIQSIEVYLPSPDTTKIEQQLAAFEQYSQLLDRSLEAYINPEIFPDDYLAREPETVNRVISVIRAYFQRLWLERNNVTPELLQLIDMEGRTPNFNLFEIQRVLTGSLGKSIQKYLEGMKKEQEKNEKKYGQQDDLGDGGGESDGGGDDLGEGEGGDDDFNIDESGDLGDDTEEGDETSDETDTEETEGGDEDQAQEDDPQTDDQDDIEKK